MHALSNIKLVSTNLPTRRKRSPNDSKHLLSGGFIIKVRCTPKDFARFLNTRIKDKNLKGSKTENSYNTKINTLLYFKI